MVGVVCKQEGSSSGPRQCTATLAATLPAHHWSVPSLVLGTRASRLHLPPARLHFSCVEIESCLEVVQAQNVFIEVI